MSAKLFAWAPLLAISAALAGCGSNIESGTPVGARIFSSPSWSVLSSSKDSDLEQSRPVAPEDYIEADGRCVGAPAPVAVAADPTADGGGAAASQPVLGGVALGMTECQVAQRAGQPANIDVGAGEDGERRVVLTYPTGNWPGIYTFRAGRLKEIQRVAAPPEPPKPVRKRKKPAPKSAANSPAR